MFITPTSHDWCFSLFLLSNKSNPKAPPSQTAWSGYDKPKAEGSVRAIWTMDWRRMSQDISLSPAHGFCQQETVPTLLQVFCLQAAAQLWASPTKSRLEESNGRGKQGTKNNPLATINRTSALKFPSSEEVLYWMDGTRQKWTLKVHRGKIAQHCSCTYQKCWLSSVQLLH